MPVFLLNESLSFPDPTLADPESGILAVGGDLSPGRLILAYSLGIFPWYDDEYTPILWHSPLERFALRPSEFHLGRTLRRTLKKSPLTITFDEAFDAVIEHCSSVPRADQNGTWLNEDMKAAYRELHTQDYAHSAEAWLDGTLVGGLYGVVLGGVFFGESMFSLVPDASKIVFAHLVPRLEKAGYRLIDCQVYTEHLARFGACDWPRDSFLASLADALQTRPRPKWPSSE